MEVIPTKSKEEEEMSNEGVIYRISGPVVTATGMEAGMYDVVRVGHEGLMGEVIELHGDKAVIQVCTKIPAVFAPANRY